MAIRPFIDVALRVSPELSEAMEKLVNDPDRDPSPETLEEVRSIFLNRASLGPREAEFLHPRDESSMVAELDRLIEEYGKEACASDFCAATASEGLSRVIQEVIDHTTTRRSPTLGVVREAMVSGLTPRLIGDGVLDEDDEGALLNEMDELIRRYGKNTLAETVIRFE
jgi:hypothetical protein